MLKYIIILLALSSLTHFLFFGYPQETVFDEVHFGKFASGYFTGEYFFDIHPPLGKLMISAVGWIGGFQPGFSFKDIGEKFPDNSYMWLRLLPALAGALLPLIIFFLARELKLSNLASFAAALLVVFENSILTQSLFILLDPFLLLFGFLGLLFYLIAKRKKSLPFFILSAVFASFALSIKWTGVSFLGIIIILEIIALIKSILDKKLPPRFFVQSLKILLIFILAPILIYFSIFTIHFKLLPKSGPGDNFHSPAFQKTLAGNRNYSDGLIQESNILEKFIELNKEMYKSNKRLGNTHPYSSKWYTWPFMAKPIYYWNDPPVDGKEAKIYLIGNPLVYWLSAIAVIFIFLNLHSESIKDRKTPMIIMGGYLLNFLPFIGINRVMFLYHYFAALIFGVLALAFLFDMIVQKRKKTVFTVLISATALVFLIFAPLSYGLPLATEQHENRIWFSGWK